MTNEEANALKYGAKVYYHDAPAIVQRVQRNGVVQL